MVNEWIIRKALAKCVLNSFSEYLTWFVFIFYFFIELVAAWHQIGSQKCIIYSINGTEKRREQI